MFEIHDVAARVRENLVLPPFYVQNLLAERGSMLLYGSAGAMKSWAALHLGYCIATGTEWCGFRTTQARVLVCNFEISPICYAVLRMRPMNNRFHLPDMSYFECSPGNVRLEDPIVFNQFMEAVRAVDPKVIVLDCLQGCYGGDENDMTQAGVWISNVARMQTELGISVVIIHHTNKNTLATGMNKSRGTTRFTAWVDSVVYLAQQPTGRQLQFEKARNSMIPELHPINIDFVDYVWQVRR